MDTVAILNSELSRLLGMSLAKSSVSAYRRALGAFREFNKVVGLPLAGTLPASATEVAQFVAYLSLKAYAPSTIASYISGLAFWLRVSGCPCYMDDFF